MKSKKFMWIGLELPKHYEKRIRVEARKINTEKVSEVAFTLPQHISLRISFQTDKHEELEKHFITYFENVEIFDVEHIRIDIHPGIVWSVFDSSEVLDRLHQYVVEYPLQEFNIPPHQFDLNYYFHSTIFYDPQSVTETLKSYGDFLNSKFNREKLQIDTVLLGLSEDGIPGQYKVIKKIKLKDTRGNHSVR